MQRSTEKTRLSEMLPSCIGKLSLQERRVYGFLLKNEDRIKTLDIREIAEGADVSRSTFVRFCKAFGYKGLKDFKIAYEAGKKKNYMKIEKLDKLSKSEEIISAFTDALEKITEANLSEQNISKTKDIAVLLKDKRHAFVHLSSELSDLEVYIKRLFESVGIIVEFISSSKDISLTNEGGSLIAISNESSFVELGSLIKAAREKGLKSVLLTSVIGTYSANNADYTVSLFNSRLISQDRAYLFRLSLLIFLEELRLLLF